MQFSAKVGAFVTWSGVWLLALLSSPHVIKGLRLTPDFFGSLGLLEKLKISHKS